MTIPILGDIISEIGDIVEKVVPDADKKMEIQLQLAQLADQAAAREDQLLQGQIEVNRTEAQSSNLFVAGWRPFIGWTSGVALAYTWIAAPIGKAIFKLTELPVINPDQIYPIVLAMLGVAGMRTYEKMQGVATVLQPGQAAQSIQSPKQSVIQPTRSSIVSKVGKWFK